MDEAQELSNIINEYGWAVQVNVAEINRPMFAYTVGLSDKRYPELLVFGSVPPRVMMNVLNSVADMFVASGEAICGDMYAVLPKLPVRLREIDVDTFNTYGVLAEYWAGNHTYPIRRAVQVLLPDKNGRFPGIDPDYAWEDVPLLQEAELNILDGFAKIL